MSPRVVNKLRFWPRRVKKLSESIMRLVGALRESVFICLVFNAACVLRDVVFFSISAALLQ